MAIKIRRMQFSPVRLPSTVHLVLSDAETAEESKVWISARFELGERSTDRLPLLALEALDELLRLIEEGREDASQPPPLS